MNPSINTDEKRSNKRTHRSDAMLWRSGHRDQFAMGWLLESSTNGFAFAWRGDKPPATDSLIDTHLDVRQSDREPTVAIVKRVRRVHDDLLIISAQVKKESHLPSAKAAATATKANSLIELRPLEPASSDTTIE